VAHETAADILNGGFCDFVVESHGVALFHFIFETQAGWLALPLNE
jgi:hypothetical protein